MITDGTTKDIIVNAAATRTSTATSGVAHIGHTRHHSLYFYWTPGASSNVLTIAIESTVSEVGVADADAVWVQDQVWTLSGGDYTRTLVDLKHTAVGTSQVFFRFDFTLIARRLRVKYSETVSSGILTVDLSSKTL